MTTRDVNWYTSILFTIGIYAIFGFIRNFHTSPHDNEFLIITGLIILLDLFPVRLPSGVDSTTSVLGQIYLLYVGGLAPGVFALVLSTLVMFWRLNRSLRKIVWFRYFTTLGMWFLCMLMTFGMIHVTRKLLVGSFPGLTIVLIFFATCTWELTNLVLHAGILRTVAGQPMWKTIRSRSMEILFPVVLTSVVLPHLLREYNTGHLLEEVGYTAFFLVSMILFSSGFLKEIIYRDQRLEESAQRYESLFDQNPDLVCSLDLSGNILSINPMSQQLTGFAPNECVNKPILDYVASAYRQRTMRSFFKASKGVPQHFETVMRHKDGREINLYVTCGPTVVNRQVVGVYGIGRDITEAKRSQEIIHRMAYYDPLTDLPNRRMFTDSLRAALEHAGKSHHMLALMVLDLDGFKYINDTLGHHYGDLLLKKVAHRLETCARHEDTVARIGGDEFTILMPAVTSTRDATSLAERALASLSDPFVVHHQELHITTSIGIAVFPADGLDTATLMKNADNAMYQAKREGKNAYAVYEPRMNDEVQRRLVLQNELTRAIDRNEFVLYYQPQYDLKTGHAVGLEALLRWNHPERGVVFPNDFIAVAEETGLIVPIGYWAVREACLQMCKWHDLGLSVGVAVNMSLRQFADRDFVERIECILLETGLAPKWLELEITESIMLHGAQTIPKVHALKQLGVHFSVDDFGTGYSSLGHLKNVPVSRIKIDRSFVTEMDNNEKDSAIISSIIQLAHSLEMNVLAEGVETESQFTSLLSRGCDYVQGFYTSRPLTVADCTRVLLETRNGGWSRVAAASSIV